MKFVDYYLVLEIEFPSSLPEIKAAYRAMSIKWHPDHCNSSDAKDKMQLINEAYAILKDSDKKARYDIEYLAHQTSRIGECYDEPVYDDRVKSDMAEARNFAKELVEAFWNALKKEGGNAAKGAWDYAQGYIIGGLILMLIGLFISISL